MKTGHILEALFYATAIALVALVIGLNCLQGTAGLKLLGIFDCSYGLTSADFRVKAGGTAIFVLFLALLFGPVAAVLERPRRRMHSRNTA